MDAEAKCLSVADAVQDGACSQSVAFMRGRRGDATACCSRSVFPGGGAAAYEGDDFADDGAAMSLHDRG